MQSVKRISVLCGMTTVNCTILYLVFDDACAKLTVNEAVCVSVNEVKNVIFSFKMAKSAGPNGLMAKSFCYSGVNLWTHLSLIYLVHSVSCILYGYLPAEFMDINTIPLVKNKCGDLTDMNNYRAMMGREKLIWTGEQFSLTDTRFQNRIHLNLISCSSPSTTKVSRSMPGDGRISIPIKRIPHIVRAGCATPMTGNIGDR